MIDAIEHVRSPFATLKEVRRVLIPDGTLMVFTPPCDSVLSVMALRLHRTFTKRDAGHIYHPLLADLWYGACANTRRWRSARRIAAPQCGRQRTVRDSD